MGDTGEFREPPEPGEAIAPPATWDAIRRWERGHGVRLPDMLAEALAVRDGGPVRGTVSLEFARLSQFESLEETKWDHIYREEGPTEYEVPGRDYLFLVGHDCGCGVVLDYRGKQDPGILIIEFDVGGRLTEIGATTFTEYVLMARRAAGWDV